MLAAILSIFLVFLLLAIFWGIIIYNRLVRFRALVKEGWSGIDVQLKRRYDLIPNLVAVVKQYSIHEREVLDNVTKMRSLSIDARSVQSKVEAEAELAKTLKTLFAVAENYPDLKANENFLALQKDLTEIEQELQFARRYYNGAVRNYNIVVKSFPSNIVASSIGFTKESYFEIASEKERETPKVEF